jgi:hypothetical protein
MISIGCISDYPTNEFSLYGSASSSEIRKWLLYLSLDLRYKQVSMYGLHLLDIVLTILNKVVHKGLFSESVVKYDD